MKASWAPWAVAVILLVLLVILVFSGIINFDGPEFDLSGNDIRPPSVRSFRINGVRSGDVIIVLDSIILTPAKLESPISSSNTIIFEADISDESRVAKADLTLFQLMPLPMQPTEYHTFDLLASSYRLEWDASDAPNGLYGASIRVVDEHQNEATVYPNVRLALLRFAGQQGDASRPTATPSSTAPARTRATEPTTEPTTEPVTTTSNVTSNVTTSNVTSNQSAAASARPANSSFMLRRRDVVFAVFATIFLLLLGVAGRLFVSHWSR